MSPKIMYLKMVIEIETSRQLSEQVPSEQPQIKLTSGNKTISEYYEKKISIYKYLLEIKVSEELRMKFYSAVLKNSLGVFPVCDLKCLLKVDLDLKPHSNAKDSKV